MKQAVFFKGTYAGERNFSDGEERYLRTRDFLRTVLIPPLDWAPPAVEASPVLPVLPEVRYWLETDAGGGCGFRIATDDTTDLTPSRECNMGMVT